MVRIGRSREPTMSDHRPAAIRPAAPSTWASRHQRACRSRRPAALGHQPHQRERPHHDLRHDQKHRHRVDAPQRRRAAVRVGEVVLGGLGARRPRRILHRHRAHDGRRPRTRRRETAAPPIRRGSPPAAESPRRPTRLPAAGPSAGCPSPVRAAAAGTSPTTSRPLAELLLAAAIPPSKQKRADRDQ